MAALHERYAAALVALVDADQVPAEHLDKDLKAISALVDVYPELRLALASPAVDFQAKRRVIEDLTQRIQAGPLTRNFLLVLIQRGRVAALPGIVAAFEEMLLERAGIVNAQVESARELAASERQQVEQELERVTGRRVRAQYRQLPELIGGLRARVGDTVYDGSVRGRLDRIRATLSR